MYSKMGIYQSHPSDSYKQCKRKTRKKTRSWTHHWEEDIGCQKWPESNVAERSSGMEITNTNDGRLYGQTDNVFYKFVILHAETDIQEAMRIKNMLEEEFQIKPGIIFADLPAGQHIMKALDSAISGSAWTILLLTENFLTEAWCQFQSHATLVNSINMRHKYNTVIPVRPKKNYLPREKTPFILRLINALEEGRPAFTQQVYKTFQEESYQKQHDIWKAERTRRV